MRESESGCLFGLSLCRVCVVAPVGSLCSQCVCSVLVHVSVV